MKLFHGSSFLASVSAIAALPAGFELTIAMLIIASLIALLWHDYAPRRALRLPVRRRVVAPARFRAPTLAVQPRRLAA